MFDNFKTIVHNKRNKNQNYGKRQQNNYYGIVSLLPDPFVGLKRPMMKSYADPPPCCDPELP
jgi:hypothetical protein